MMLKLHGHVHGVCSSGCTSVITDNVLKLPLPKVRTTTISWLSAARGMRTRKLLLAVDWYRVMAQGHQTCKTTSSRCHPVRQGLPLETTPHSKMTQSIFRNLYWIFMCPSSSILVSRPKLEIFNVHMLMYAIAHWGCMHTVTTVRECNNSNTVIVDSASGTGWKIP